MAPAVAHTAGNLIAVFVVVNRNPGTITISDTQGNSYTPIGSPVAPSSTLYGQWFYAFAQSSGENTVTASFTNSTINRSIRVLEYSNIDTSSPVDAIASGSRGSTSLFTTSSPDELILAGWHVQTGLTSCTAGAGYTLLANDYCSTGIGRPVEQRIVSSIQTGVFAAMGRTGNTSYWGNGWVATFKGKDTPVFSPQGGSYGAAQNVTLNSSIPSATICYTTDGTDPITDSAGHCLGTTKTYTGAITVSSTQNIRTVATKSGRSDTVIASAVYNILPSVSAPTFSVPSGTYTYAQAVSLSSTTSGATICYTTDGTDPITDGAGNCTHGSVYSSSLSVAQTQTVKAIATMNGYGDSSVASAAYIISGIYGPVTHVSLPQQSGPGTSVSAPAANHTAGNLLAVFVVTNGNPGTTTISDTQSNSYISVAAASAYGGHPLYGQWFYAFASATGANIVTASFTNSVQNYNIRVLEYAHVRSVSPLDTFASGAGATTPAFTTTYENDLILAGFHAQWVGEDNLTACSAGDGYTLLPNDYCSTNIGRPVVQKIASSILTNTTASIVNTGGTVYSGWAIALKGEDPVAFSPAAGTYDTTQSVTLSSTISGATICYTTDGADPTTNGAGTCTGATLTYSSAISVSSSMTIKAVATKSGQTDSAIESAAYVIDIKPTFSLAAGIYPTAKSITLAVDNAGATICYTTDGADPTTNGAGTCTGATLTYSSAISVSSSMTIKAVATKSGDTDSTMSSASYIIDASQAITFTTIGSTFAPEIAVTGNPTIYWEFSDGTTSNSITPSVDFGTAATRTQYLVVTPWSAVTVINLGYDAGDSGTAPISLIPQQNVSAVAGISNVASSLQIWASSHNPLDSLNFSNFTALTTIECYQCTSLDSITLAGTSSLIRLNLENNHLEALDLSQAPNLEDLRATSNEFMSITWPEAGMPHLWHLCAHSENNLNTTIADLSKFPALIQLWIRNDNQTGTLRPVSTHLTSVWGQNNHYSAGDFTGNFPEGNSASLYMQNNELTSLILADDPGLIYVDAYDNHLTGLNLSGAPNIDRLDLHNNEITSLDVANSTKLIHLDLRNNLLTGSAVNDILEKIDGFGTYGGYLDLSGTGNAAPSFAAQIYAHNLRSRGWTVLTAGNSLSFGKAGNGGTGTVTISDGTDTITCGSNCTSANVSLSSGSLTLAATADEGSTFIGWSDGCTGTGTCTVSLSADINITATFSTAASGIHGPITHAETIVYHPNATTLSAPAVTHTQGNLIAVFLGVHENTGDLGITDTQGNTYTAIGSPALVGGDITGQWFYAFARATSRNTVTATFNGSYSNLRVLEYSGIDPISPVDAIVTGAGGALTFSTTVADELVLASWHTGATTCTPGSGFMRAPGNYCNSQIMRPTMQGIFSSIQSGTSATVSSTGGSISGGWLVSFKGGSTASAPTFSPAAGTYTSAQDVTLTTATPGATIHYTIDGSMPTTASSVYSSAIPISSATTIRAIAARAGYANSGISIASYSILPVASAPTFSLAAGTYTSAQSVTLTTATSGASIYYTTNGDTPTSSSTLYSGPISISSTATIKAIAIKAGYEDSIVASARYTINISSGEGGGGGYVKPTASQVKFSPEEGTYKSAQAITLSTATSNANIYYTLDGTTPTSSSLLYSSPISVSSTSTIKAIAIRSGYNNSPVSTAVYTIVSEGEEDNDEKDENGDKPDTPGSNLSDGTLIKLPDSPKVYVIIDGKKKWISTPEVFEQLGYKWTEIKVISGDQLSSFSDFEDNLIRQTGDYKVYLVVNGIKRHIPNPEVFLDYGFQWGDVKDVDGSVLGKYPNAYLIRETGKEEVFYVKEGVRKHIPTVEIFDSYGDKWEDVQIVSAKEMMSYTLSRLIRMGNSPDVYLIENGVKKRIPDPDTFMRHGFDWAHIIAVNQTEFDYYKNGEELN